MNNESSEQLYIWRLDEKAQLKQPEKSLKKEIHNTMPVGCGIRYCESQKKYSTEEKWDGRKAMFNCYLRGTKQNAPEVEGYWNQGAIIMEEI